MLHLESIVGQKAAVETLRAAHARSQIANAYLFVGPPGVGKFSCSLAFAAHVLGEHADDRLDRGAHPDVRIFHPREDGAGNIKVETLREELLPFTRYAPFEGEHAFAIFPDADVSFPETHAAGANAILKTLEEPKEGLHFILCTSRPRRLLPTIRSRCQAVRFGTLEAEALFGILARHGIPADEADLALSLANGRADLALAAASESTSADALNAMIQADAAVAIRDWGALSRCAESLAKSELRNTALRLLCSFYRDVAACKLGAEVATPRWRDEARERAGNYSLEKLTWATQTLGELESKFHANANPQLVLESFLLELANR